MQRLPYTTLSPKTYQAMAAVQATLDLNSLESSLKELIKIRASQLNGCAFCLDMHIKTARKEGEREIRLHHIAIWRESPLFTERERIALALTDALTKIEPTGLSDALYEQARTVFSDTEITEVVFSIAQINAWNRLGVAFRSEVGSLDKALKLSSLD